MESIAESLVWGACGRARSGRGSLVMAINLRQLRTGVHRWDNLRPDVVYHFSKNQGDFPRTATTNIRVARDRNLTILLPQAVFSTEYVEFTAEVTAITGLSVSWSNIGGGKLHSSTERRWAIRANYIVKMSAELLYNWNWIPLVLWP
jgi:hypothetical protein